jgi:hypothetical protein
VPPGQHVWAAEHFCVRTKGVVSQPKRWIVEQTYGILMFHRRLVRDYEHLPASKEIRDLVTRLARESPAWEYRRMHGELIRLGHQVSEATVRRTLRSRLTRSSPVRA